MKFLTKPLLLLWVLQTVFSHMYSQKVNNDYRTGPLNVTLPRTPESGAFEKYGDVQVSELTGSPNIAVPVYTLKSKFLEVPITLKYNATGIRVSQEASWVGLGFDLDAGGRITVETKGCADNDGSSKNYYSPSLLKYGMQKLFNRLGNGGALNVFTFASTCFDCDTAVTNDIPDHWATINAMGQFGVGEPDIFRANFMGHSLTFYYDKITDSLRFLGEKSLFSINSIQDNDGRILSWTLTDNSGIVYNFNQTEKTTMTLPPLGSLTNNTSTTAWLLTKIAHPYGDSIVFSYSNYGYSYPSSDWGASSIIYNEKMGTASYSDDNHQNEVIQQPYYLTKVETNAAKVEFILQDREDIKGLGSKRVSEVRIVDKLTNSIIKRATFSYDYFNSSLGSCYASQPDSLTKYLRLRLKLNSLTLNDSASQQPPYKFFYFTTATIPDKKSFAQDHWGYYNANGGTHSDPCSPKNLIPNTGAETQLGYPGLNGFAITRECTPDYLPMMTMDSIVYPTGGSTKFIYEPPTSVRVPTVVVTGGGLRVNTIRDYSPNQLARTVKYSYYNGRYSGAIQYWIKSAQLQPKSETVDTPIYEQDYIQDVISSNGLSSESDLLIAYQSVRKTELDPLGRSNGYVIKKFNLPALSYANNTGFELIRAHWPDGTVCDTIYGLDCYTYINTTEHLYAEKSGHAPTPAMQLDGKLDEELYYDKSDNLLKAVRYHYSTADFSQKYYSVRVRDNRVGGADANGPHEFNQNGSRRFSIYVSTGKSFYTLIDSVIERTYYGNNTHAIKRVYKYNKYFQPEYESVHNSDGTQTITYTKTSLDLQPNYPLSPTGDALELFNLRSSHIYDAPIETTVMKRIPTGDSVVIQSQVNLYQNLLLKRIYQLETATPITFRNQFIPAYYDYAGYPNQPSGSSYTFKMDSRYKLHTTGVYSPNKSLTAVRSVQGSTAYILDEYYNNVLAKADNADTSDVAYSSFETPAMGRWNFNAAGIKNTTTAPTGSKVYLLSSGNLSVSALNTAKSYVISYWSKGGSKSVNGAAAAAGMSANGWTYYEHLVNNPTGGNIDISGTDSIDEVRVFPKTALISTFTYAPLIGLSAQSDATNRISYYEYDDIGRLARIKDQNRNIVKQFQYKYGDIFQYPFGNDRIVSTATKACAPNYVGTVPSPYTVRENTYGSFIDKPDANRKAQQEVNENGQAWADSTGLCLPYYDFNVNSPFQLIHDAFNQSDGQATFNIVVTWSTSYSYDSYMNVGTISGALYLPATEQFVTVLEGGREWTVNIKTTGSVYVRLRSGTKPSQASLYGTYTL